MFSVILIRFDIVVISKRLKKGAQRRSEARPYRFYAAYRERQQLWFGNVLVLKKVVDPT
jgi:hypothetical protein